VEWLNVTAVGFGLLAASFLSATVLPGGSEALLWGFLHLHPAEVGPALMLATSATPRVA
jgi:membrane protein YqaA with SNARE-associated domain